MHRQRLRWLGGLAVLAFGAALIARTVRASDHDDDPTFATDPGTDIGDVYAFMRPGSTSHLALVLTVHPSAAPATAFDSKVEYQLRVRGVDDPGVDTRVTCRFQPPAGGKQIYLCQANGVSAAGEVGKATSADEAAPLRAWAGLRAEPAFGDVAALDTTLATKKLAFTDAGVNAFAGKNVLAVVVELDVDRVLLQSIDAAAMRPILAVSASTERL